MSSDADKPTMTTPDSAESNCASGETNSSEVSVCDNIIESLPTVERYILHNMIQLAATRANAEISVVRTHENDTSEASKTFDTGTNVINTTYNEAKQKIESEFKRNSISLDDAYEKKLTQVQNEFDSKRKELAELTSRKEALAKSKWKEEIWLTESVFEANSPLPRREYEKYKTQYDERLKTIESLSSQAENLLEQYHHRSLLEEFIYESPESDDIDAVHDTVPDETTDRPRTPPDLGNQDTSINAGSNNIITDTLKDTVADPESDFTAANDAIEMHLANLKKYTTAKLFRGPLIWLFAIFLTAGAAAGAAWRVNWQPDHSIWIAAVIAVIILSIGIWLLYKHARVLVASQFLPLKEATTVANSAYHNCLAIAARNRAEEEAQIARTRDSELEAAQNKYAPRITDARKHRKHKSHELNERYPKQLSNVKKLYETTSDTLTSEFQVAQNTLINTRDTDLADAECNYNDAINTARISHDNQWSVLKSRWVDGMLDAHIKRKHVTSECALRFPEWDDSSWNQWTPPDTFAPVIRFGSIAVDLSHIPGGIPESKDLTLDEPNQFILPALLTFPDQCSLLFETDSTGRKPAIETLQVVMLRLLTSLPPGKVRFTIADPVSLGENFAGFMHLTDYAEALVGVKIWTEARHIEQQLADLTEHMENVIQKYLRNEFSTIAEYNKQAGEIAEPYRFFVMADCPVNLSETAARRLTSIANSGMRCGVFTLIVTSDTKKLPAGLRLDDFKNNGTHLVYKANMLQWEDADFSSYQLTLDTPPDELQLTSLLHTVGKNAVDSSRVEVPFGTIAPRNELDRWSCNSAHDIHVPLGRCGATKLQYLTLGHGTAQHVLLAGKTGSGKSTLLHILITNLALWYSPDEIQLYLVDFKKGVEFKTYATHELPHAKAIAIESDREFGLSVLKRVDSELKHRGNLLRQAGAQDLPGYRKTKDAQVMPRILLIIDEFQEFFTEDDKLAQDASLLLDRLIRQGRAFGIHVLLGSQTLGGAYSLARSTIGQMAVRIALQCSEADSFLIMNEDNAAARLLSRPGEAIYNDASGMVGGNSPFQISWLSENERDTSLDIVSQLAADSQYVRSEPLISFEGSAPADLNKNHLLSALLDQPMWPTQAESKYANHAWIGDAIAIKDPTAFIFRRQSGGNALIVGQRDEAALAIMAACLISLSAQVPTSNNSGSTTSPLEDHIDTTSISQFLIIDGTAEDDRNTGFLPHLANVLPHNITIGNWRDVDTLTTEVHQHLNTRRDSNQTNAIPMYLLIHGLQRFRSLKRSDDDFGYSFDSSDDNATISNSKMLADILSDGPGYGIHTILWCDTLTILERFMDRNALREFDSRVLFQMSSTDSTNLIDSPIASKLGMRRALFQSEDLGQVEKFRPYALPNDNMLELLKQVYDLRH